MIFGTEDARDRLPSLSGRRKSETQYRSYINQISTRGTYPFMNATQRLARFALDLDYRRIPASVIDRAKACILDTLAVSLYGSTKPWSRIVVGFVRDSDNQGGSTVFGANWKAQAPQATLANGVMAHAFELDNVRQPGAGVHPGAT